MDARSRKPRRTDLPAYWRRQLLAWSRSGLTQVRFCRERGLSIAAFTWWKGKLRDKLRLPHGRRPRSHHEKNRFIEVQVGNGQVSGGYELRLTNGRRIAVPDRFDAETLRRLIQVAETPC